MKTVRFFTLGCRRAILVDGSLAALGARVDALVSSDDNYLSHGGGVSEALWSAAGQRLSEEVEAAPRLRLGDVFVTRAYDLDAEWLIHAVTVDFDANRRIGPREARDLFGATLDRAADFICTSIAFPLLGSGAGRLTPEASALAAFEALDERASLASSVTDVYLVASGERLDACLKVFAQRVDERRPLGDLVPLAAGAAGGAGSLLQEAWRRWGAEANPTSLATVLEGALRALAPVESDESQPLSSLLERARETLRGAGTPLPSRVEAALSAAIGARNRLVHSAVDSDAGLHDLERQIIEGIELAVRWMARSLPADGEGTKRRRGAMAAAAVGATDLPSVIEGIRAAIPKTTAGDPSSRRPATLSSTIPHRPRAKPTAYPTTPAYPEQTTRAAPPAQDPTAETAPVRRLCRFLLEKLPPEALEALLRDLEQDGYRGPPDMRLLEHCVRLEDPVDFLSGEFTIHQLRAELRSAAGMEAPKGATIGKVAALLLESLGFPAQDRPVGLHAALRDLRAHRPSLHTASLLELKGAVADAGSRLEYLIIAVLRFLCQAAFRESPETYFRRNGRLKKKEVISRASLRPLLDMLESLSAEFERGGPGLAEFCRDVGAARIAPRGSKDITKLRNTFVHFDREHEKLTLDEARRKAGDFFDQAIAFLEYLADPANRVFPHIIRIEKIVIDRWGRRLIEAVNEEGGIERIFTDRRLEAGQVYFMHPLTNPLRVDPILVPAGELDRNHAS